MRRSSRRRRDHGGVSFWGRRSPLKSGISSSVLVEQVRNTAAWLWQEPACASLTAIFDESADEPLEDPGALVRALRLRLAAHYATVATFVPTDVDAHIRHHMWVSIADAESLRGQGVRRRGRGARRAPRFGTSDGRPFGPRRRVVVCSRGRARTSARASSRRRGRDAGCGDRCRARPRAAGVRGRPRARRAGHDDARACDDDRSQPRRSFARRRRVAAGRTRERAARALLAARSRRRRAAPPRLPARGHVEQRAHGAREPQVSRAPQAARAAPQPRAAAARRAVVRRLGRNVCAAASCSRTPTAPRSLRR